MRGLMLVSSSEDYDCLCFGRCLWDWSDELRLWFVGGMFTDGRICRHMDPTRVRLCDS